MSDETPEAETGAGAAAELTAQACDRCLAMPSATVDNTFGPQTNVYRVGDKLFALVAVDGKHRITLKTLPEEGVALRAQYESVTPGYHMNKRHWITVDLGTPMPELNELIAESYRLVFTSLPKKRQAELA